MSKYIIFMCKITILAITILASTLLLSTLFGATAFSQENNSLNEQEALLAYEKNTVEIAERFGPSVVTVSLNGDWEKYIENIENIELELDEIDFKLPIPFLKEDSQGNKQFSLPWQDKSEEENFSLSLPENWEKGLKEHLPEDLSLSVPKGTKKILGFVEDTVILPQSTGSGFLIDQVHILTNYHLVKPTLLKGELKLKEYLTITVRFPNSDADLAVEVVSFNSDYNLALLKLQDPKKVPEGTIPLSLGNSDTLQIGQKAIVLGSPLSSSPKVISGIISALDQEMPAETKLKATMIQIDADISLDNSGGPLLNSKGEVIGISTVVGQGYIPILGPTSAKMGFAVPSNLIAQALEF